MENIKINRRLAKREFLTVPSQSARDCIGKLEQNFAITGITKGQFSLLDLIRATVDQTGPAALTVSTWSTGIRDTNNVKTLIDTCVFSSVRLLLDRSFLGRHLEYAKEVRRVWGNENIRMTRNHAKFFMLRNEKWDVCCRSSMNLNLNPRLEQFDIDDNPELCDFFEHIVDELFELMPPGLVREVKKCDEVFGKTLGGDKSENYISNDSAELSGGNEIPDGLIDDFYRK